MAFARTTARLLLRELDESYLDSIAEMMRDPRVNEYFYGFQRIKNSADMPSYTSDYFFTPFSNTHAEFGIGGFAIHERGASAADESTFVGITGFFPPTSHHWQQLFVQVNPAPYHCECLACNSDSLRVDQDLQVWQG